MASRRLITLWWDVNEGIFRDSDGSELRTEKLPGITLRERLLLNLHLITDSDKTQYTDMNGVDLSFEAAVDNTFRPTALMVKTLNDGINAAGDWEESETADKNVGELSIKLNANTSAFATRLGTTPSLSGVRLEVIGRETSSGDLLYRWVMPFKALNIVNDSGAAPESSTENFQWFIDPATGKKCLRIVNNDGEVLEILTPAGV